MLYSDHWDKNTAEFVIPHLINARQQVRIATGYFTVQGYNLIRHPLENKRVYILVGFDEASQERLRQAMIENLEAHLRRWDIDNRRQAVEALIRKLRAGELSISERPGQPTAFVDTRIRQEDHTKVYILDEESVLVGSSNLSASGLRFNHEGVTVLTDPDRVSYWVERYEKYWNAPDTVDLTEELLRALLSWLELDLPFDIYLKTIEVLASHDDIEVPRRGYRMPIHYQWVVIKRLLRQLEAWRGAMLVASTGLGKTVMATHVALVLREHRNLIRNVVVFAPKGVKLDWEEALDSAGVSARVFVRELLDQPEHRRNGRAHQVRQMLEVLARIDERYLVIIDESHYYSNRIRPNGTERRSFKRLVPIIKEKLPFVLLLTATPYTKEVDDINNQLYLLPHTAPPQYSMIKNGGQMTLPVFGETGMWCLPEIDQFFERFVNDLPVTTIVSTSTVARDFATRTSYGDYVEFPDGRRGWIPRIFLRKVKTPVPLEDEVTEALKRRLFEHEMMSFPNRGEWRRTTGSLEREVRIAWASSPLALREVLLNTVNDTYDFPLITPLGTREEHLWPLLHRLEQWSYEDDAKFMELVLHLKEFYNAGKKVIIYVERLASAVYLEDGLKEYLPSISIANTVMRTESGRYDSKRFEEVIEMVIDFAPRANATKRAEHRTQATDRYYDILISTDAYGVGMNLQDASVVVSYDLAWTAGPIIQRAGRVLRFWDEPRDVSLYAFIPGLQRPGTDRSAVADVEKRLQMLRGRTAVAEQFSELPIIPHRESDEYHSLSGLAHVNVEDVGLLESGEIEEFNAISPFLRHYQAYHDNIDRARQLGEDLVSALEYNERIPRIYVLFRYQGAYEWAVMQIPTGKFEDLEEDALLNMIQCTSSTALASIPADEIEVQAQRCKRGWCTSRGVDSDDVERICALYLAPHAESSDERLHLHTLLYNS